MNPPTRALVSVPEIDDDTESFPEIEREFVCRFVPSFDWVSYLAPSPRNRLRVPLERARIGLVTTAGAHSFAEEAFRPDGEARLVSLHEPHIALSHPGYDTARAGLDPEDVVPSQTLLGLAESGFVGSAAPIAISTMGFVPDGRHVLERAVPRAIEVLRGQEVDLALLVPA